MIYKYVALGGRTRANFVCFTNNWVKIGAFPNATPTSKIWKTLSLDQKDQRRRSVWVGQAEFFQNLPNKTKIHRTSQLRVYLRQLMYSTI